MQLGRMKSLPGKKPPGPSCVLEAKPTSRSRVDQYVSCKATKRAPVDGDLIDERSRRAVDTATRSCGGDRAPRHMSYHSEDLFLNPEVRAHATGRSCGKKSPHRQWSVPPSSLTWYSSIPNQGTSGETGPSRSPRTWVASRRAACKFTC